jgi:L-ascorbate metabolism protein UlaG (beta-lactamase superfamily)
LAEGKTIYHAGDTGLFTDMQMIGKRHPIDVAFLPIGDNFTMGPEDAAYAVELLNPKLSIPIHYDTFPAIEQNPNDFKECVENHEVLIMSAGQSIEL